MKITNRTHAPWLGLSLLLTLLPASPAALADASPWSLRAGPAWVVWDASATVAVGGAVVPGGTAGAKDNTTLGLDIGYALNDRWTLRLAFGVPPTTTLSAGGTLRGMVPPLTGTLGNVKYGPAVLSATWKAGEFGAFQPYVGAGVNYTHVFASHDGDIAGLNVRSALGTALQAGFEVPLDARWRLFLDARKIFVKTTATGAVPALGGPPAKAWVTLDPLVVHAGVAYRF